MRPQIATVTSCLSLLLAVLSIAGPAIAAGPTEAEIQRTIARAAAYLRQQTSNSASGENALRAYALMRAGDAPDSPVVARIIEQILAKCQSSYDPRNTHIYTAAVDLMALEAAGASLYQPQIQMIADYLISKQNPNGSWDYVDRQRTAGDTSQTQYALLGLWAADRAGIQVPTAVWDGAARWHLATQLNNGGWTYHPDEQPDARHTMTVAGIGSLHLCRRHLAPGTADRPRSTQTFQPKRKFGILEPVEIGAAPAQPATATVNVPEDRPRVSRNEVESRAQRGLNWLTANYTLKVNPWQMYYLYGIERMGALAERTTIGEHDWYAEGAGFLVAEQKANGTWTDNGGLVPSTAFGILFLARATSQLLDHKRPTRLGGGLLAGGRGLPENLNEVQVQDGKVAAKKPTSPIDELLAELERPNTLEIQVVQTALVEQIQLGDREELIGQKERLKTLAADPRIEVRRTAVWALGHTGDLRMAPLLIEALRDQSIDVNIEAHNALCTLSRNPAGLGLPSDPLADVPEDAAEEQRRAALAKWRDQAYRKWRDWYLTVRPYDERDDLTRLRIGR